MSMIRESREQNAIVAYLIIWILNVECFRDIPSPTRIQSLYRADPATVILEHESVPMKFLSSRAFCVAKYIDIEFLHAICIFLSLLLSLLGGHGLCDTSDGGDRTEDEEADDHDAHRRSWYLPNALVSRYYEER